MAARIDDNDQQFMDDHWTYESGKPSQRVTYPLDADRFWKQPGALEEDASGRCVASGVRANIWARARRRADITHLLRGGGRFSMGLGALRWQETLNTDEVRFGRHRQNLTDQIPCQKSRQFPPPISQRALSRNEPTPFAIRSEFY